jgi:hypothetical protein
LALVEQWGVPLAVLGLLLATLLMASLVHRYQAHQAAMRAAVRRVESGLLRTEAALSQLVAVPLSRELRVTLRRDLLARCQRIARLYRRYPDIARRISEAERTLNAEGAAVGGVGPIESEQRFRAMNGALNDLIAVMSQGDTLQPIPADVRVIFRRELGERQAEVQARFHLVAARRCESEGNLTRARAHLTTLLQLLRRRAPATAFVSELAREADNALAELGSYAGVDDNSGQQPATRSGVA